MRTIAAIMWSLTMAGGVLGAQPEPFALEPLPLGTIKPEGWLANQLQIQADGLTGHLDEFWPDVRDSGWIGGDAEGWERGPYWLDGLVPLAYLLDDPALVAKAERWMNYILEHQHEDGWLGPLHGQRGGKPAEHTHDAWPTFIAVKAMTQYYEATGDNRVIPALLRYATALQEVLEDDPLFEWGRHRWMDGALSMLWLYERTGDERLLDTAKLLERQGYDWRAHFTAFPYRERTDRSKASMDTHVVNNAMGIKAPGISYRLGGGEFAEQAVFEGLANLDRYHGQATGLFSGDEHLAGKNPSQGTELCAVVEYLYSLEYLIATFGEPALADRMERIAFNALPATFKPDMWAHQYDQQANQVIACIAPENVYTTNGPDSNLFGLEPNYGCCTSNMHQGWPKFAAHLWMKTPDNGLAAVAYAPCTVQTRLGDTAVSVRVDTKYPFRESVAIAVTVDRPATFPLVLRIPEWAQNTQLEVSGDAVPSPKAGSFCRIEREWEGETLVTLRIPMRPRIEQRFNDAVAIHSGPLVLSLKIEEEWRQIRGELPHADWEVHPLSPWNYALALDPENPAESITVEERPLGANPFSPEGAPIVATVKGTQLPGWTLHRNAAAPVPQSPVQSDSPKEQLTLIPYGCTNLRLTEFPTLTK